MKSIILRENGPAENLRLEEVPDPVPKSGEVIVALRAAALNHRDVWIRTGKYAGIKLPVILGSDGSGKVEAVADEKDNGLIGAMVLINPGFFWGDDERAAGANFKILGLPDNGTYAERVAVPAGNIKKIPSHMTMEEAAALPLGGVTAYRAVVTRAQVQNGETVLITGIGGGVALFAMQIALSLGAKVFVTSSSDEKIDLARKLGASGGVNYNAADCARKIIEMTNGGPDVVIDSAGGKSFDLGIEVLKAGGRLVNYGATAGPVKELQVRRIFWKQLSVLGSTMGSPKDFAAMIEFYSTHHLHPVIDSMYPLEKTPEAHRKMEAGEQFGKIVLTMDNG